MTYKTFKIILKAIWLAFKEADYMSTWKLLNFKKNIEFIQMLDLLKEEKKL